MKKIAAVLVAGFGLLMVAPSDAAPVQYVQVCSLYGDGYFYIPGTEKCVNPDTGVVKYQTSNGTVTTTTASQAEIDQALAGTAISLAMKPAIVTAGHKFAVAGNVGTFGGKLAVALSGAVAANDNVTVSGGLGLASSGDVAAQGGINVSW